MSENTENSFSVTVLPTKPSAEPNDVKGDHELQDVSIHAVNSDSSNLPTGAANGNNVSFVNITYAIQPHSIKSRFTKIPLKKILDDVRYVCMYVCKYVCVCMYVCMYVCVYIRM